VFDAVGIGRGTAFGDFDNDGDVDIVVTQNGGPAWLLLCQTRNRGMSESNGAHWVELSLRAPGGNRFGLGARVGIERSGLPTLWRRVRTDGSYLSASDARVHVGLGASSTIGRVIVQWPEGNAETFTGVPADRITTLTKGQGQPVDARK
jgi:hypothetical protein